MRGPLKKISLLDENGDFAADGTELPFDDVNEEGSTFPGMDEATQNVITGEADGVSVKAMTSLALLRQGSAAASMIKNAANSRTRLWIEFTDADGAKLVIGGDKGCKVRYTTPQDLGYGKRGFVLATFEVTGGSPEDVMKLTPNVPGGSNPLGLGTGLI